jgi:hypothetical protein
MCAFIALIGLRSHGQNAPFRSPSGISRRQSDCHPGGIYELDFMHEADYDGSTYGWELDRERHAFVAVDQDGIKIDQVHKALLGPTLLP